MTGARARPQARRLIWATWARTRPELRWGPRRCTEPGERPGSAGDYKRGEDSKGEDLYYSHVPSRRGEWWVEASVSSASRMRQNWAQIRVGASMVDGGGRREQAEPTGGPIGRPPLASSSGASLAGRGGRARSAPLRLR